MCFLIPALVGLTSALLGYLLGKMLSGGNDLNLKSKLDASISENEKLNNKLYLLEKDLSVAKSNVSGSFDADLKACREYSAKLEAEIADYKHRISVLESQNEALKTKITSAPQSFSSNVADIPFDADSLFAVFGKKFKKDDLKIVEGIGPKIEELYHEAGIKTWKELSDTTVSKSREILDNAGSRYAIHNPETWAKQALLAYQGKWKELKDYQDSLNAGKE